MKGQTQALTTVLVTTIILGVIAAGYTWGTNILEKRQSQASLNNVESKALELEDTLVQVADSGKNSIKTVKMDIEGELTINESTDSINISVESGVSPYPSETWKLLEGDTFQNLSIGAGNYATAGRGEDSGVVAVKSFEGLTRYRIEFRNLKSGKTIERIDLRPVGSTRENGKFTIILRNVGTEIDSNYQSGDEVFTRKRKIVEVDLK